MTMDRVWTVVLLRLLAFFAVVLCGGETLADTTSKPVDVLSVGRPEALEDGSPRGWNMQRGGGGQASVRAEGPDGAPAFRIDGQDNERGYNQFQIDTRAWASVRPGATYRLVFQARGRGRMQFRGGLWTGGRGNLFESLSSDEFELSDEWREISHACVIDNPRAHRMSLALRLFGGEQYWAEIGPIALMFDPADNPGLSLDDPTPVHRTPVFIATRDAEAVLIVGEQRWTVAADAETTVDLELKPGLALPALQARAVGARPAVQLRLTAHPETDGRWRTASAAPDEWNRLDFDDAHWAMAAVPTDGWMWAEDAAAPEAWFRQVLLWNSDHLGPDRCIMPQAREWGFSRQSLEHFNLILYSPLSFALDTLSFEFEMPIAFRLLDILGREGGRRNNLAPRRLSEETFEKDGEVYRRYRLEFDATTFADGGSAFSLLPVRMDGEPDGEPVSFFYRRLARGNFTELTGTIPVRVLPPIDGRRLSRLMITQYGTMGMHPTSASHIEALVQQSAAFGMNFTALRDWPGTSPGHAEFAQRYYAAARRHGIRIFGNPWRQVPYWATAFGDQADESHLGRWTRDTPGARVRHFKDSLEWAIGHPFRANMNCPTFAIGEGAEGFQEALYRDYVEFQKIFPDMEGVWLNWERRAWESPDGSGDWCFCDRCKTAFREFAELDAAADLSDDTIFREHYDAWERFRQRQSGRLHREMRIAFQRPGLRFMSYSWPNHRDFWDHAGEHIDIAFAGVPGTRPADRYNQEHMDRPARYFRETLGVPFMVGQRFSTLGPGPAWRGDNWRHQVALSDDGRVDARSWKIQVVRMMAAMDGVDLHHVSSLAAGMAYYIGEATRLVAAYEDLFADGARTDDRVVSDDIAFPDALALTLGDEVLVLLFNESAADRTVTINIRDAAPGQTAVVFEQEIAVVQPAPVTVEIPAGDVVAIHVR